VATSSPDELSFFASQDPRSRFFRALGFEVPEELDEIAGTEFYGTLSRERAEVLDRDLLVWDQLSFVDGGRATIEADPLLAGLAVMREGRTVFLEGAVETAFGWNTILSIPIALDGIEALVAEAQS
jgi:iron complex transport system substrate-binding protein